MIYMFLADGFEEVEALCPLDILRRAGLEVTTVGIGGKDVIRGAHGIIVHADIPDVMYRDSNPDMLILPGGMPGSKNLDESRIVESALRAASRKGAILAAICAAPMVLGKRGYLEGKRAVCFPGFEEFLTGATVDETATVVRDGNIVTAKGMGAAFDFGLELVRSLKDDGTAEKIRDSVFAK
jgi:4-methyl-5(b-hydroxyethyl)-thiazole monophosphate biosynthesis